MKNMEKRNWLWNYVFWDIKIRQAFAEFEEHTRTQFTIFRGTQKEKKEKKIRSCQCNQPQINPTF